MKVYIVTSGSYSDYQIDRVFLDKEKAETYVKLSEGRDAILEEYEADDDKLINKITYVYASYRKDCSYSEDYIDVRIIDTNSLDTTKENLNNDRFWLYMSGEKSLTISRALNREYEEENIKNKYKKVLYDLMAKIESLLQLEGWDEKMVQEWLGQNVDEYLNKN